MSNRLFDLIPLVRWNEIFHYSIIPSVLVEWKSSAENHSSFLLMFVQRFATVGLICGVGGVETWKQAEVEGWRWVVEVWKKLRRGREGWGRRSRRWYFFWVILRFAAEVVLLCVSQSFTGPKAGGGKNSARRGEDWSRFRVTLQAPRDQDRWRIDRCSAGEEHSRRRRGSSNQWALWIQHQFVLPLQCELKIH